MKLVRHGAAGHERPGLLDAEGRVRDLSALAHDITPAVLHPDGLATLAALDPNELPPVEDGARLGPPLAGIGNIVCIGLNYRDHAKETGAKPPSEPVVFSKHTSALNGPYDPVRIPPGSVQTDWEVELGVIIGAPTRMVAETEALAHVAGYCTVNDVSERDYQKNRGGQWIKGKSSPTFCPVGPWLVTADEVPDPQALKLSCAVNGRVMQNGSTADMIFPVATVISYLSRFMTLMPGDLICTGTPAGVGLGRGEFLKPGDVMDLEVEGLGRQRQTLVGSA